MPNAVRAVREKLLISSTFESFLIFHFAKRIEVSAHYSDHTKNKENANFFLKIYIIFRVKIG